MRRSYCCNKFLSRSLNANLPKLRPVRSLHTSPATLVAATAPIRTITELGSPYGLDLRDLKLRTQTLEEFDKRRPASFESSESLSNSYDLFVEAIAMVSGQNSQAAYQYVLALWQQVFFGNTDGEVKQKYLIHEDKMVNLMINKADYDSYRRLIKPLLKLDKELSRAQFIMETFQFQRDKTINNVMISEQVMEFFSSPAYSREMKHQVLAFYLRKAILYFGSPTSMNDHIESFMEYSSAIEPFEDAFCSGSPNYDIYRKVFRLFLINQKKGFVSHLQNIRRIMLLHTKKKPFGEFLTHLMELTAFEEPKKTIDLFDFKGALIDLKKNINHTPNDLKHIMNAYMQLKDYDNVLKVHAENRKIHTEDHIEILLRLCAKTRDWKSLQTKFESMYGQGDLPREVHYTVVMRALVAVNARREIKRLLKQLKARNLKPNVYMYIYLMSASYSGGDMKSMKNSYSEFLELARENLVPKEDAAKLLPLMIEFAAQHPKRSVVIEEIERIFELHKSGDIPLINIDTLIVTMRIASALYSEKLSNMALEFARMNNLLSDRIYYSSITFHTQMGHFMKAEQLALEAHLNSLVPFQNALIYSAQLKNYRVWAANTTNTELLNRIHSDANTIINVSRHGPVSQRDRMELLNECAKYALQKKDSTTANGFFKVVWKHTNLKEKHFLPLFNYYSKDKDGDSDANILSLYGKMTSLKVELSARTYYYVIRALADIDAAKNEGFANSVKIFHSVLKMYDLVPSDLKALKETSVPEDIEGTDLTINPEEVPPHKGRGIVKGANDAWATEIVKNNPEIKSRLPSRIPMAELTKNAVSIVQLVHYYTKKWLGKRAGSSTLALKVIDRLVQQMGENVSVEIRREYYQALAHVYFVNGDLSCANKFIDKALNEFQDIFSDINLDQDIPKLLSLRYDNALGLKYHVLKRMNAPSSEYVAVLSRLLKTNVCLERSQFDRLFLHVIQPNMPLESFKIVLECCERYLVAGNMADVKLSRLIGNVFRHFMVYKVKSTSEQDCETKFGLLCGFYGLKLTDTRKQIKSLSTLRRNVQLEMQKLPQSYRISFENLNSHPSSLFVPGRPSWQKNYINPSFASQLVRVLDRLCAQNANLAFSLYEKYPETFEYLLIYREERYRLVAFQNDIRRLGGHFERSDRQETHKYIVKVLDYVTTYGLPS